MLSMAGFFQPPTNSDLVPVAIQHDVGDSPLVHTWVLAKRGECLPESSPLLAFSVPEIGVQVGVHLVGDVYLYLYGY